PVGVDVGHGDGGDRGDLHGGRDAEGDRGGEETGERRTVDAAERLDVPQRARAAGGDDVSSAVAVHVTGRHKHVAEIPVVGEEAADEAGQLRPGGAVEDLDVALREDGADDHVGDAVAGHVAGGDADAAGEPGERLDLSLDCSGDRVELADIGGGAGPRAD